MTLSPIRALLLSAALCAADSTSAAYPPFLTLAAEWSDEGDEKLEDLIDEFDERMAKFMQAYQAEQDETKREQLLKESYPRPTDYAPRFRALAAEFKGTPAGAGALIWIATNFFGDTQEAAVDELLSDYKDSPLLEQVMYTMGQREDDGSRTHLRSLLADSPHRSVRASACHALALNLRSLAANTKRGERKEALMAESRALLMRVQEDFGDLPYYGRTLGDAARAELFESDHLQIGMLAPDIEGPDLNGVAFKLSDYRGKVVVLDFWGDW